MVLSGCITINIGSQTPSQASSQTPSITVQPSNNANLGTITGYVLDQNKEQIPMVRVTLWQNGQIVNIPNNPQITSDGSVGENSVSALNFTFDNVPMGNYVISAEKEGHTGFTNIDLNSNYGYPVILIPFYSYILLGDFNPNPTLEPSWNQPPVYQEEYSTGYVINGVSCGILVGRAVDSNDNGIPNANITLWQNGVPLNIPENPQLTNDGRTAAVGMFAFYQVPFGDYILSVNKGETTTQVNVNVNSGTVYTGNIVLS